MTMTAGKYEYTSAVTATGGGRCGHSRDKNPVKGTEVSEMKEQLPEPSRSHLVGGESHNSDLTKSTSVVAPIRRLR